MQLSDLDIDNAPGVVRAIALEAALADDHGAGLARAGSDRLAMELISGRPYLEAVDLVDALVTAAASELKALRGRLAPAGNA